MVDQFQTGRNRAYLQLLIKRYRISTWLTLAIPSPALMQSILAYPDYLSLGTGTPGCQLRWIYPPSLYQSTHFFLPHLKYWCPCYVNAGSEEGEQNWHNNPRHASPQQAVYKVLLVPIHMSIGIFITLRAGIFVHIPSRKHKYPHS